MDGLGATAAVIDVIKAAQVLYSYVKAVKNASNERSSLERETRYLLDFLNALRDRISSSSDVQSMIMAPGMSTNKWRHCLAQLEADEGPLRQIQVDMERLTEKLKSRKWLKIFSQDLVWPFEKEEVDVLLEKIERLKSLIQLILTGDLVSFAEMMQQDLLHIKQDIGQLLALKHSQNRETIENWLSNIDFRTRHHEISRKRHEGIGNWILINQKFVEWMNGKGGLLWCRGMPGAGKTVLASFIFDRLSEDESTATACVYCDYKSHREHTTTSLLRSILKQIVQSSKKVSTSLAAFHEEHKDSELLVSDLRKAIQTEQAEVSKCFIVVDALDELQNFKDFSRELLILSSYINVLVTSCDLRPLEIEFAKHPQLNVNAHNDDIRHYIQHRISSEKELVKLMARGSDLESKVIDTVVQKSNGMFLLAKLHLDSLALQTRPKDVETALEELPQGINTTYAKIMERIEARNSTSSTLAKKVLMWVSHARRPLSLQELQHAVSTDPDMVDITGADLHDEDDLVSICEGLVIVERPQSESEYWKGQNIGEIYLPQSSGRTLYCLRDQRMVRLVHHTAQKYLRLDEMHNRYFPSAENDIVDTCLKYMAFSTLHNPCSDYSTVVLLQEKYPLLEYAGAFWGDHARLGMVEASRMVFLIDFLMSPAVRWTAMHQYWVEEPHAENMSPATNLACLALGVACRFGLQLTAKYLMDERLLNMSWKAQGFAILTAAARGGQKTIIDKLLGLGISTMVPDGCSRSLGPLLLATRREDEMVVQSLLEHDIPLEDMAIVLAAEKGSAGVLQAFLKYGGLALKHDMIATKALNLAVTYANEKVVCLLLDGGVVPQPSSGPRYWPLHESAKLGHKGITTVLLNAGIPINQTDSSRKSPLMYAASHGHVALVKELLQYGADPRLSTAEDSVLAAGASSGSAEIVHLLLNQTLIANMGQGAFSSLEYEQRSIGYAALARAAASGSMETFQLLLHLVVTKCESNDQAYSELLAEQQVAIDETLAYAAEGGNVEIVRSLVEKYGASVKHRSNVKKESALVCAAAHASEEMVRCLVEDYRAEVDQKHKGAEHRTALLAAVRNKRESIVRRLLSYCPSVDYLDQISETTQTLWVVATQETGTDDAQVWLLSKEEPSRSEGTVMRLDYRDGIPWAGTFRDKHLAHTIEEEHLILRKRDELENEYHDIRKQLENRRMLLRAGEIVMLKEFSEHYRFINRHLQQWIDKHDAGNFNWHRVAPRWGDSYERAYEAYYPRS